MSARRGSLRAISWRTIHYGASLAVTRFAPRRGDLCLAAVRRLFPRSVLVRPIITELRRLIDVFAGNGTQAPSRFSSPKPTASSTDRDPTAQLSSAARIGQRLDIHSLLRQANFVDDEDEAEDRDGTAATPIQPDESMSGHRRVCL